MRPQPPDGVYAACLQDDAKRAMRPHRDSSPLKADMCWLFHNILEVRSGRSETRVPDESFEWLHIFNFKLKVGHGLN